MAGTKEIKAHIGSIQETRKITSAMYLIASTKLRRARQELDNTRPYFEVLQREIKRIFRTAKDVDSHYFYPVDNDTPREGTYGCLVITADKGLAGSYNQNAIREAMKLGDRMLVMEQGKVRQLDTPALAHIPIIALYANAFESDRRLSIESGMDAHLAKPLDVPLLLETITRTLQTHKVLFDDTIPLNDGSK